QGGDLYGEAVLAGSGNGTVIGAWVWDGNITEQFTTVMAGGGRVSLRSRLSFPTTFIGVHTVELRILQPNVVFSRPVSVMVGPQSWSTERILAPAYGPFAPNGEPPLLRWTPVPGSAKYQVGFSTHPFFASITTWHDVSGGIEWRVPSDIWNAIPEGEVYWTVRAVEMSGTPHKELPMRLLVRFPADALSPHLEGGTLLRWQEVHGNFLYQISFSEDAAGTIGQRRYLTGQPTLDLHALLDGNAQKTYYVRVAALKADGHEIVSGPAERITLLFTPSGSSTPPATQNLSPLHGTQPISKPLPPEIQMLENRLPAPNSNVNDSRPSVIAEFKSPPNTGSLTLLVDGTDVTSLAHVDGNKLSYTPAFDLVNGQHTITVILGRESSTWRFMSTAASNVSQPASSLTNDAELRPRPAPLGAVQPSPLTTQSVATSGHGMQMQSQVGV